AVCTNGAAIAVADAAAVAATNWRLVSLVLAIPLSPVCTETLEPRVDHEQAAALCGSLRVLDGIVRLPGCRAATAEASLPWLSLAASGCSPKSREKRRCDRSRCSRMASRASIG